MSDCIVAGCRRLWAGIKQLGRPSAIDFGLRSLGSAFAPLFGFALRLAMLLLFFWYVAEFVHELKLEPQHKAMVWVVIIGAVGLALAFLVAMVRAGVRFDPNAGTQPASVLPFVLLNLLPIAIVAFATWWRKDNPNFQFHCELLEFTQKFLTKIANGLFGP